MRSSAVTAESLKQRIYADNWHLTALNIFPCALIFLYAETGEKPKDVHGTSDNQSAHFDF